MDESITHKLQKMYQEDDAAKRIFNWFDDRKKDSWEMPVRIAAYRTGLSEYDVRRVFKELETLECGRYIKGRYPSGESRMQWELSIRGLASTAKGESTTIGHVPAISREETLEAEDPIVLEPSKMVLDHTFQLRADYKVEIKLPSDLSEAEAKRLAAFLVTLPIE